MKLHQKLLCERKRGKLQLECFANIDQTPLLLELDSSRTYDTAVDKDGYTLGVQWTI